MKTNIFRGNTELKISNQENADLFNMYHTSKMVSNKRYDRMIYTIKHFTKKYPDFSKNLAYKLLDRSI